MPSPTHISGTDLWDWREWARRFLEQSGDAATEIGLDEVDWLLQAVAGVDRLALRLGSLRQQTQIQMGCSLAELTALWQRRVMERVPLQYLVGRAPWRQFDLKVAPGVLIPRPETEDVVELVLAEISQTDPQLELAQGDWADLGTGSGAIALGLATALPQATLHAVDRSQVALAIATENAHQLGLQSRMQFYHGDWFTPLAHLQGKLSGMVSNPPYIPTQQVPTLQPEVAQHEPWLALDGGADGLDCIRILVAQATDYLRPGGVWLVECMAGQAAAITALLQANGHYDRIHTAKDLAGIERFAIAHRRIP